MVKRFMKLEVIPMSNEELKDNVNKIINEHILEYIKNNPLPVPIYRHQAANQSYGNGIVFFELVTPITKAKGSSIACANLSAFRDHLVPSSFMQLLIDHAWSWISFDVSARKFDLTLSTVRNQIQSIAFGHLQLNWLRVNKVKNWNKCKLSTRGLGFIHNYSDDAVLSLWFDAIQYKLILDDKCNSQLNVFFAKQFENLLRKPTE